MTALPPKTREKEIALLGAVRISDSSFFVYKNGAGNVQIKSGGEDTLHKNVVKRMIKLNPRVSKLLSKCNIKVSVNTKTLKELTGGHMNETCRIALGIYERLSERLKSQIDVDIIKKASIMHDLGKVLIPSKILNKPSKLNKKERRIMNIHSTLGYELLKTQNIDSKVLDLIKYHHQNLSNSGYPIVVENHEPSMIGVQIISTADKYSALREKRVYRRRLTRMESLLILYKEVREGKIHKDVYDALVEYASVCDAA